MVEYGETPQRYFTDSAIVPSARMANGWQRQRWRQRFGGGACFVCRAEIAHGVVGI